jgi:predicted glycoside hydrolase/deacetylase ChbG (UPF0249 family)
LSLNAEWDNVRWGPLLPSSQVPSLVDAQGYFHSTPDRMRAAGAVMDEAFAEMQAQLELLRKLSFPVSYADEHMLFGRVFEGYEERFEEWCSREGLVNFRRFYRKLPQVPCEGGPARLLINALEQAEPGLYTLVTHPAYRTDEMLALGHAGKTGQQIAEEREQDTRLLTDPDLKLFCSSRGIRLLRYDEAGQFARG